MRRKGQVNIILLALALLLSVVNPGKPVLAANIPLIGIADFFPEIQLPTPDEAKDRQYLKLEDAATFKVSDIKVDLVLVEILNVYCSGCQKQAPVYNKLFKAIEKDPATKGRIKFLGIAAGNSRKEVAAFRKKFNVPFPIVPDPQFKVHRELGGPRTPYSLYLRQDIAGGPGVVAGEHLGYDPDYQSLHYALSVYMTVSISAIRGPERHEEKEAVAVEPTLSESELAEKVKSIFASFGQEVKDFERLPLEESKKVYTAVVLEKNRSVRLFAEAVSRPSVCDVCHDIHFIYVFDTSGKILAFSTLQLTKRNNKSWNEVDVAKIQKRILGHHVTQPLKFQPEIDAVSSATITSAVIFDSLNQGKDLLTEIKDLGLLQILP